MRFIFSFLLCLTIQISLSGQDKLLSYQQDYFTKFESLTEENGLPGKEVYDIIQDSIGFIWFATDNGLCRYDGYNFITFQNVPNDSSSISNNIITCLSLDKYGRIWAGTENGLNLYQKETETFQRFYKSKSDLNSLNDNYVMALFVDNENNLWIETEAGVLHKFDIATRKIQKYKHQRPHQPYYRYHAIYEDNSGILWIGGRGICPTIFDRDSETFIEFPADPNDPKKKRDNDVACFMEDSQGNFWISATDGVYQLDRSTGEFIKVIRGSTYSIIEDQNGNIWFGSSIGLLKLENNKTELINYQSNQDNPASLITNSINKLYEDRSGIIWIATERGVSKYSPVKNMFSNYRHLSNIDHTLSGNIVTSILEDKNKQVWIATKTNGLNKLNPITGEIRHFKAGSNIKEGLSSNKIRALYNDRNGDIWIGLWAGIGFNKMNPDNFQFKHYVFDPKTYKRDWYNDFIELENGQFLCGFWGNQGLMEFNRKSEKFSRRNYLNYSRPRDKNVTSLAFLGNKIFFGIEWPQLSEYDIKLDLFTAHRNKNKYSTRTKDKPFYGECEFDLVQEFNRINAMYSDGIESLYCATDNGLIVYNRGENKFSGITKRNHAELLNNEILGLYEFDNDLLCLVSERGLNFYDLNQKKLSDMKIELEAPPLSIIKSGEYAFLVYQDHIKKLDIVHKIIEDEFYLNNQFKEVNFQCAVYYSSNRIIVGTNRGACFFDLEKGVIIEFFDKSFDNRKNWFSVTTLFMDNDGEFWLGTDIGVGKMNFTRNTIEWLRNFVPNTDHIIKGNINAFTEDRQKNIWIGMETGVCLYNKQDHKLISLKEKGRYGLSSRLINKLFQDVDGNLWIGTSDKGLNVLRPNGDVLYFPGDVYDESGFRSTDIQTIFQDSKSQVWVGGNRGLNRFQGFNQEVEHYDAKKGLAHHQVMAIQEDSQEQLWISTQNGISCFDIQTNRVISSYRQEDGLQDNSFTGASCKLSSGVLLFGGYNGISVIDPKKLIDNRTAPNLAFTAINKYNEVITNEVSDGDTIIILPDTKFFSIEFAAMNFTDPLKVQYRYKLSRSFKDWILLGNEHKVAFTNLAPGQYVLEVSAAMSNNVWNKKGISMVLILKPPFWKTPWFMILVALLIIFITTTILMLKINSLKRQQQNLTLEQRLFRAQMNPHFIFNVLAAVQGLIYNKETKTVSLYLSKFASLVRSILYHSKEEFVFLNTELEFIENYLNLQQLRFSDNFSYQIELDEIIDKEIVLIPPMLLQPFIENSIEHGFRNIKTKDALIQINIRRKDDDIEIQIKDNGIGIEQSKMNNEQKAITHKSLGMMTTMERIKRMYKNSRRKSLFTITDLSKLDSSKSGTQITFRIPYIESY